MGSGENSGDPHPPLNGRPLIAETADVGGEAVQRNCLMCDYGLDGSSPAMHCLYPAALQYLGLPEETLMSGLLAMRAAHYCPNWRFLQPESRPL